MNNVTYHLTDVSKEHLTITFEPDIHLSTDEQTHLDQCLSHLYRLCHIPLVLYCTLISRSSTSNTTNISRESIRINQYLRVRQPRKFYWMRNIKYIYLHLRLPTNRTDHLTASLMEFHSCQRLSYSARTIIEQIKPILLVYNIEEHVLKLNIRGENTLLQLIFSSHCNETEQFDKGIYYKWSDEGHIRSTTIQFHINYDETREDIHLSSNTIDLSN